MSSTKMKEADRKAISIGVDSLSRTRLFEKAEDACSPDRHASPSF